MLSVRVHPQQPRLTPGVARLPSHKRPTGNDSATPTSSSPDPPPRTSKAGLPAHMRVLVSPGKQLAAPTSVPVFFFLWIPDCYQTVYSFSFSATLNQSNPEQAGSHWDALGYEGQVDMHSVTQDSLYFYYFSDLNLMNFCFCLYDFSFCAFFCVILFFYLI